MYVKSKMVMYVKSKNGKSLRGDREEQHGAEMEICRDSRSAPYRTRDAVEPTDWRKGRGGARRALGGGPNDPPDHTAARPIELAGETWTVWRGGEEAQVLLRIGHLR
jgi:hypothetical protein